MEAQKPNTPQKPVAKKKEPEHKVRGIKNAIWVIVCCAVVAVNAFIFVFGNDANFDPNTGHPINIMGTIFMGGFIVPILMTLLLTVIVLSIERWIAISSAAGKGNTTTFVADIKADLAKNDIDKAMQRYKT